jgi:hypothetical protein
VQINCGGTQSSFQSPIWEMRKRKYKRKIKSFVRRAALSLGLMTRLLKKKKKTGENQLNEWNNLSLENQQPNRFYFF